MISRNKAQRLYSEFWNGAADGEFYDEKLVELEENGWCTHCGSRRSIRDDRDPKWDALYNLGLSLDDGHLYCKKCLKNLLLEEARDMKISSRGGYSSLIGRICK